MAQYKRPRKHAAIVSGGALPPTKLHLLPLHTPARLSATPAPPRTDLGSQPGDTKCVVLDNCCTTWYPTSLDGMPHQTQRSPPPHIIFPTVGNCFCHPAPLSSTSFSLCGAPPPPPPHTPTSTLQTSLFGERLCVERCRCWHGRDAKGQKQHLAVSGQLSHSHRGKVISPRLSGSQQAAHVSRFFFEPALLTRNPTRGQPPIHKWRIPSSKGAHVLGVGD